jgi:hypothetical protein
MSEVEKIKEQWKEDIKWENPPLYQVLNKPTTKYNVSVIPISDESQLVIFNVVEKLKSDIYRIRTHKFIKTHDAAPFNLGETDLFNIFSVS